MGKHDRHFELSSEEFLENRINDLEKRLAFAAESNAKLIKENYPEAEVLMGTSTAGIAHAAITAHILDMPMGYVRSGAKDHGRQNQIEGRLEAGQKVIYKKYSGTEVTEDKKDYLLIKAEDILAVIE